MHGPGRGSPCRATGASSTCWKKQVAKSTIHAGPGICGTCVVRVLAGIPQHNDDILDDEQRASGTVILPCVSRCNSKLLVLDL